jgi:hypothetical protein
LSYFAVVDPWNFLVVIVGALGLLALGKWVFRSPGTHFNLPNDARPEFLAGAQQFNATTQALAEQKVLAPDSALGTVRITKFYFAEFDLATGPPNSEVFYDELFVELYDADTGHRWMQSYGVATPRGLEKILQDKSWGYLFANGIIVLPKYDLTRIREAVIARLAEDNETFEPAHKPNEEEL